MFNSGSDFISKTIITKKVFEFQNMKCYYQNTEVMKGKSQNLQNPKIKIENNLCKNDGERLVKKTNIILPDREVSIEDVYDFKFGGSMINQSRIKNAAIPTPSTDGSQQQRSRQIDEEKDAKQGAKKKKLIFKKKYNTDDLNKQFQKRNTKNIAKNFCKAFNTYLIEHRREFDFKKLNSLSESENYNNRLIVRIVSDQHLKKVFEEFLHKRAHDWIKNSKISDKEIHIQAINIYLNMIKLENGEGWAQLNQNLYEQVGDDSIYYEEYEFEEGKEKNVVI